MHTIVALRRGATSALLAVLAAAALVASAPLRAQEAPDALVKRVSSEVVNVIKTDPQLQAGDQARIRELIETRLLQYFDFTRMTSLAVGTPDFLRLAASRLRREPPDLSDALANPRGDHSLDAAPAIIPLDPKPAAVLVPVVMRKPEPTLIFTERAASLRQHYGFSKIWGSPPLSPRSGSAWGPVLWRASNSRASVCLWPDF